ncbi:hypothetical protein J5754_01125 [bacterium]|nr:hypothetical protein [bacterium]
MRSVLLSIFVFAISLAAFSADTVYFGGMRIDYSGKGYVVASPYSNRGAWNVWDIKVVDNAANASRASLTIKPLEKDPTNFCVRIRSISAPALDSLKVTFPPGENGVGYVQNITVDSGMRSIAIVGGDLGSNEGGDGTVKLKSALKQMKLSGLKNKNKSSGKITYWGGNLWSDVEIGGNLDSFLMTGGNFCYRSFAEHQRHGIFSVNGSVKKFAVKAFLLKDEAGRQSYLGGFVSADLIASVSLDALNVAIGGWHNGIICAPKIGKVTITGPSGNIASLPAIYEDYGLRNASITTINTANPDYFTNYYLGACSFRSANVVDSVLSAHGSLKGVTVAADKQGAQGFITNSILRAGCGYDADFIPSPKIFAYAPKSGLMPAGTNAVFTMPFFVTNCPLDSVSSISLASRGQAWDCVISNDFGEVFSGFDQWSISDNGLVKGYLVWDPSLGDFDFSGTNQIIVTGLKIRVAYGSSPERHTELPLSIRVKQQAPTPVMTNKISSASAAAPTRKAYPGNLVSVNCQNAVACTMMGGLLFGSDESSEHATYMGSLNAFKASVSAKGNLLYSKKNIKLDKYFDYENNEVWIGGARKK